MGTAKLITYDLVKPEQDYPDLIAEIKKFQNCVYVQRSVWLVNSSESCNAIVKLLKAKIDSNDMILVVAVENDASWVKARCSNESLQLTFSS